MRWITEKLIPVAIVFGLVWLGSNAYSKYFAHTVSEAEDLKADEPEERFEVEPPAMSYSFSCDGRTRCSEMTSCEEATYFLEHCPGVKMDGDGDSVPCERQWC